MLVEHDLQMRSDSPIYDQELVRVDAYTKEDLCEAYLSENEVSDIVTEYIQELEDRISKD